MSSTLTEPSRPILSQSQSPSFDKSDDGHSLLRSRQSIRRFKPEAVSKDALERIFQSATFAPSAHNRQPWRFVIVSATEEKAAVAAAMGERLKKERLADGDDIALVEADVARSRDRICEAPVAVFVFMTLEHMDHYPDAKRRAAEAVMAAQSCAMATQNLLLAAHVEGLGSCVMCAPLFCSDVVTVSLNVPETWEAQMLVLMGKPSVVRERKGRLPLEAVVQGGGFASL